MKAGTPVKSRDWGEIFRLEPINRRNADWSNSLDRKHKRNGVVDGILEINIVAFSRRES